MIVLSSAAMSYYEMSILIIIIHITYIYIYDTYIRVVRFLAECVEANKN